MNPLTFAVSPGEQICCFMEQEKRASKSEDAVRVRSWEQAGEHISHDAALYLPPKWHLYLPKLSFDSLPHTEQQITFNTDIKSSSKVCPKRWKAALLCGTWLLSPLFTVSLWLTVAKLKKKNQPLTIALSANHIVPFVIIQNPQYSGAWHTGWLYLATINSNEDKGYP